MNLKRHTAQQIAESGYKNTFCLTCKMSPNVQKTIFNHMMHIASREIYAFVLFDGPMIDDAG